MPFFSIDGLSTLNQKAKFLSRIYRGAAPKASLTGISLSDTLARAIKQMNIHHMMNIHHILYKLANM